MNCYNITEGLWLKGTLEIICFKPLAQAEPPRTDCPHDIQMALDYLQGWRLHNILNKPEPMLPHPHSKKMCFLMFRWNLLYFSLCPLPLVLSLANTEKSLVLSSLHPPLRYLYILVALL